METNSLGIPKGYCNDLIPTAKKIGASNVEINKEVFQKEREKQERRKSKYDKNIFERVLA